MTTGTHSDGSGAGLRGDELDAALWDFFRSQMPAPWPSAPRPWALSIPRRVRRRAFGSRLALAASVGLLAVGLFGLADRLRPTPAEADVTAPLTASPKASRPTAADRDAARESYRVRESLLQKGERPTEWHIEIIPNR